MRIDWYVQCVPLDFMLNTARNIQSHANGGKNRQSRSGTLQAKIN